jgi:putative aldouronate transport system permease protein
VSQVAPGEGTELIARIGTLPPEAKTRRDSFLSQLRIEIVKNRHLYLMAIPMLIFFLIFSYWPMYGVWIAFERFVSSKGIIGSQFIGLHNFQTLLSDLRFLRSVRNTLIITSLKLLIGFPAPIVAAILINEANHAWSKKLVQTATFLPYFISWIVISTIVGAMLDPSEGPISKLISLFISGNPVNLMGDNRSFRWVVVLSNVWKRMGWYVVIYLGAISGIDPQQYEAASMDGASRIQKIRYITLPGMALTIAIFAITEMGWFLWADFEQIYAMYSPIVYDTGDIIDTYVYRIGLQQGDFSIATAAGLLQSSIGLILLLISNSIAKKITYGEAGVF